MSPKVKFLLSGVCGVVALAACQSNDYPACPEGLVETTNLGMGDSVICCPVGTLGQDGYCVDTPTQFEPAPTNEVVEPETIVAEAVEPVEEDISAPIDLTQPAVQEEATKEQETVENLQPEISAEPVEVPEEKEIVAPMPTEPVVEAKTETIEETKTPTTSVADDFVYLTAPNGKGSAYCPKKANSLAWNGIQFKCCGYGLTAVEVPSRDDSLCCPMGSVSARWIGEEGFDYECCPSGLVEVKNQGAGDKYICCQEHEVGKDGVCVTKAELAKEGKVLLTAPNGKGQAYCPEGANSLAWDAENFQCCGKGMKATVVPSRTDSICCPSASKEARWVGKKWNDFECCPEGMVEVKNQGIGDKYLCCPEGSKALDGECLSVK